MLYIGLLTLGHFVFEHIGQTLNIDSLSPIFLALDQWDWMILEFSW